MKLTATLAVILLSTFHGCPSSSPTANTADDTFTDPAVSAEKCARTGGLWTNIGAGDLAVCVQQTGEGQKQCTTGRDCKGECLANSGTCSPYKPLIGCNEVIGDSGLKSTTCYN